MNRYWSRIALGALLVFCVGMTGMYAVRKGKAEVTSLLTAAGTRIPLQLANLKFRLDRHGLGEISSINVNRKGAADLGRIRIQVALADPSGLPADSDCGITLDGAGLHSDKLAFRCAVRSEIDAGDLVEVGQVAFQPSGVTRPLYVEQGSAARWKRAAVQSLDASMARDGHGGVEARGSFDLRDGQGAAQRGSFNLKADPKGTVISVRDDQGRNLLDFTAGAHGVNLNIHDRHGRNLIKLLADSLGAALRVRH